MHPDAASSGSWHRYQGHLHPNAIDQPKKQRDLPLRVTEHMNCVHSLCWWL
jgi:hypothetical protein